jgi:hypothetical protein
MGFYLDEDFSERIENIDETIFGNLVLYAKWDQFVFEVKLDIDNGTYLGETVFNQDFDTVLNLGTPSRLGYRFDGWVDGDLNIVESNSVMPKRNLDLKATYSLLTYTITYELDEETYFDPITTYTVLDTVVFGEVIKEKHTFEGFKLESINGASISEIQPGSLTGDIIVFSIFTRIYDNEWYFTISEQSNEMIEIALYIGGYVNFAGFDATISYNETALEIHSINNSLGSILNTETLGEIQAVFVDALNVKTTTTLVMTVKFNILSDEIFNLLLNISDMITISENFDIIDVEYFIKIN